MYLLIIGEKDLDISEKTTKSVVNKLDLDFAVKQLIQKYPDYTVNRYKLDGKYIGKCAVTTKEYTINDKGEVYPAWQDYSIANMV